MVKSVAAGSGVVSRFSWRRLACVALVAWAALPIGQALAEDAKPTQPAAPQATVEKQGTAAKQPVAAAANANRTPTATNVQTRPASRRYYRGYRASGGPSNYNYSGIGFPRMEGGLTAAANRTTWLKPMNRGRRGGW